MDPNYGSPKWVTFTDAMDDAMEGGKLFPITRRMSVGTLPYISTSASSSASITSGSGGAGARDRTTNPLDFSQSYGFGEEMKGRNQPEKISGEFGAEALSSGSGTFHFEEDQNTNSVCRKISAESNLSCSSGSFSNCDQQPSVCRKISAPSTMYYDSNLSSSSGSFSNSFDGITDKYSVFSKLEKTNGGKGWGRKVLGSSPMGWSDEILGSSVDSDDESELAQASRPNTLKIEEEPWHSGAALVGRKTWEKSPSRDFVRNFP